MTLGKWTEEDWQALVSVIKKGKCILMLGPETAVEEVDGKPQLLCCSIANLLAQGIDSGIKNHIDPCNLMETAQYYSLKWGKNYLHTKVHKFYNKRQSLTSNFHRNLAALPFRLAINTSPDHMFHTALTHQGKAPKMGWYNFKQKNAVMDTTGTDQQPMVFYLYGQPDEEDSLVLTENDLLDFLVSIVSKDTLPDRLINAIKEPDTSFLFLGFGFKHWYLRILLHILAVENRENHSIALEDFTPHSEAEFKSTVLFYQEGPYKIRFFNHGFDDFAKELRRHFELAEESGASVKNIPKREEKRPKVFICHASENKEIAHSLYKKLDAAGFDPWLDKENLYGGDKWDEAIIDAIEQEIDYFLVLQSKDLENKVEGYVNKEIAEALERQKKFRGANFIIPVKIEECKLLPELNQLQTIDLGKELKTDKLIQAITRDLKKRGRI
jgi:TIR domain/SIR2-like domain